MTDQPASAVRAAGRHSAAADSVVWLRAAQSAWAIACLTGGLVLFVDFLTNSGHVTWLDPDPSRLGLVHLDAAVPAVVVPCAAVARLVARRHPSSEWRALAALAGTAVAAAIGGWRAPWHRLKVFAQLMGEGLLDGLITHLKLTLGLSEQAAVASGWTMFFHFIAIPALGSILAIQINEGR